MGFSSPRAKRIPALGRTQGQATLGLFQLEEGRERLVVPGLWATTKGDHPADSRAKRGDATSFPDPLERAHCPMGFFKPERKAAIWPNTGAGAPGSLSHGRGKENTEKSLVVGQQPRGQLSRPEDKASCRAPAPEHEYAIGDASCFPTLSNGHIAQWVSSNQGAMMQTGRTRGRAPLGLLHMEEGRK